MVLSCQLARRSCGSIGFKESSFNYALMEPADSERLRAGLE